ncbi:PhnE/PtxC family ABC transporter permease [Shewanella halifaxensis]|uniref:PhnE/PtxC family ABC transporter permease n=1 Tax=Shewanella halifaxensis TaxID=271098 RepID=UPI000D5A1F44|nr:ABC transporter permease [Shewanella halifaxensis]
MSADSKRFTSPFAFVGYWQKVSCYLLLIAGICFFFADTEIIALDPWHELVLIAKGFVSPDFFATEYLINALWQTVGFALLGVSLALCIGAPLSLIYHKPFIACICAFTRSIHELFWALLFLQIFGLSPLTGILAIGLPYGATFARVFSDILQQAPMTTSQTFAGNTDRISRYVYGRLAHVLVPISAYIRYRFECGLKSSAVLGFVGMPTLGFYLETAFRQGHYHQAAALLILFISLIGTIHYWCRLKLLPVYWVIAVWSLPVVPEVDGTLIWRFISHDILPPMLQTGGVDGEGISGAWLFELATWLNPILYEQALPGMYATLLLAVAALGMTYTIALVASTMCHRAFAGLFVGYCSRFMVLICRSVPEYIFAFVFLLLLGPSMLPAMLALAVHNGALIAYLIARQSDKLPTTDNFNQRIDNYAFEVLPAVYPNMMALLFYRFEVILRETAILGMLGVATLGFYIDSNFAEIRYNGAIVLLLVTALINILVDIASRRLLHGKHKQLARCC